MYGAAGAPHHRRDAVMQDVDRGYRFGDREDEHANDHHHIGPRHGHEVFVRSYVESANEVSASAFDHIDASGPRYLVPARPT